MGLKDKLIIIANYSPDKQESMLRFSQMIYENFSSKFKTVEIWYPSGLFDRIFKEKVNKWLAYIDKWLLYPIGLFFKSRKKRNREAIYHIVDHSNSPYIGYLPNPNQVTVTCHDVLAIRGALGYKDAYCEASRFGTYLQKYILRNLLSAPKVACVSSFTMNQLNGLDVHNNNNNLTNRVVIYNSFNDNFDLGLPFEEVIQLIKSADSRLDKENFILHVGSSLPRKNRELLTKMLQNSYVFPNMYICYAGQEIDEHLKMVINESHMKERVISIVNPNHKLLYSLYSMAKAFVFPSFSEGFGWPLIEAQLCGTLVIASNHAPMPEIGGEGAIYADPEKPETFTQAFEKVLNDNQLKVNILKAGKENIERFKIDHMVNSYWQLYNA